MNHYANDRELAKAIDTGKVNMDKGARDFVQTEKGTYFIRGGKIVDKIPVSEHDARKRRHERENEGK